MHGPFYVREACCSNRSGAPETEEPVWLQAERSQQRANAVQCKSRGGLHGTAPWSYYDCHRQREPTSKMNGFQCRQITLPLSASSLLAVVDLDAVPRGDARPAHHAEIRRPVVQVDAVAASEHVVAPGGVACKPHHVQKYCW